MINNEPLLLARGARAVAFTIPVEHSSGCSSSPPDPSALPAERDLVSRGVEASCVVAPLGRIKSDSPSPSHRATVPNPSIGSYHVNGQSIGPDEQLSTTLVRMTSYLTRYADATLPDELTVLPV
jgi:hypothetical protein